MASPAPGAPRVPESLRECPTPAPCPFCGRAAGTVYVHGHVQCLACGLNVDPCCGGARGTED